MSTEKGNFSADISASVIEEALKSVKRHSGEGPAPAAAADGASPAEVPLEVEGEKPDEPGELRSLKAQLEVSQAKGRELLEKLKDEHERTLRAVADLENSKKRVQKERDELLRFGQEKLLKDFLPVVDNLDRAIEHAARATDPQGLQKGIEMVRKLMEDTLAKHGLKSFSAVGQSFDPRLHEAMNQVETADVPPNSVVSEMVRGYTLHERLLRPALVTVSKAPAAPAAPAAAAEAEQSKPPS